MKIFRYGILISVLLILVSLMVFSNPIFAQQTYRWRAVTHQLVGTARYEQTVVPFCEMVEKASGGRLIIEPYGAGVLFPVFDTLDAVRDGVVQMAMLWSGYWQGKDPVFALAGGRPGDPIMSFSENFYRSEKLAPLISEAYAKQGVTSLGSFDFASPEILMSKVPIRTLEEFKGKNIRSGGLGADFYDALGASSISLSGPEIYTALQLGTVDAAEYNDWLVNMEMGFHEVTDYVIEPSFHTGATDDKELIVNPAAWNSLPDDLKNIVISARDMARYLSAIAYDVESQIAKGMWVEDFGVEIIHLPEEDIQKAREIAAQLVADFGERTPETKKYVEIYAEVLNDLGYVDVAGYLGYDE